MVKKETDLNWYIWYTKPRAEKKIRDRLLSKQIEVFLPLRKELRQWSDRKNWVESPLFGGYIFTHIHWKDMDKITFTEGILNYVRMDGRPAFLKEEEVESIKNMLQYGVEFEVADVQFDLGEFVEITSGPLKGLEGNIIQYRGNNKLAISIAQLGKTIMVSLPAGYVRRKKRA